MKRTANSVGDTLIQRQPDDALALALELVAAIEVLRELCGELSSPPTHRPRRQLQAQSEQATPTPCQLRYAGG
jgi:hypothetical protein